jgi:UrcA family protein
MRGAARGFEQEEFQMRKSLAAMSLVAIFAGAAALSVPASAQDTESITVNAPRFHGQAARLNGPLEKVSYTGEVRYDDLNLRTRHGARELRLRVRDEAQDVCTRIAEVYPVREAPGTSCYKTALSDGLIHANEAIRDARYQRYSD